MSAMLCPNCEKLVDTDYHPEVCPCCQGELFPKEYVVTCDDVGELVTPEEDKARKFEKFCKDRGFQVTFKTRLK